MVSLADMMSEPRFVVAEMVEGTDLLIPVLRDGRIVGAEESLEDIRERTRRQSAKLHPGIRRFMNPHEYPVGIDIGLHERRDAMIRAERAEAEDQS